MPGRCGSLYHRSDCRYQETKRSCWTSRGWSSLTRRSSEVAGPSLLTLPLASTAQRLQHLAGCRGQACYAVAIADSLGRRPSGLVDVVGSFPVSHPPAVTSLLDRGTSPAAKPLNWASELSDLVQRRSELLREVRRHLHQHPEPSGQEVKTTRYIASMLAVQQLDPVIARGGHGLWVDVVSDGYRRREGGVSRPQIGIRGDIDALWIQDEKRVEYRSRVDGVMHACGHDAHTAIILGAIISLAELSRAGSLPWPIACRAIFQPAEETNQGALQMIEEGAIGGLTHLLGLHVDSSRCAGTIGLRHGDFTADCYELEVEIQGRGAHAARPHESVDPIAIAAQLITAIYQFVPRSADSQDPVVVTFGQIHGGHAANVIPDHVVCRGTLRTQDAEVSQRTLKTIRQLARGMGEASGAKIDVRVASGPPPVKNDPELVNLLSEAGRAVLSEHGVQSIRRPSMGGEDFANYLPHVRAAMFRLGIARDPASAPPLHNPKFDIDERALRLGAEILAHAVVRWCDPKIQAD